VKEVVMLKQMRIELARESDAMEFERFVVELGLHPVRSGATVAFLDDRESIGDVVTSWLATWGKPLVPTELPDGRVALRPPAA
jgi:hypothetical protein